MWVGGSPAPLRPDQTKLLGFICMHLYLEMNVQQLFAALTQRGTLTSQPHPDSSQLELGQEWVRQEPALHHVDLYLYYNDTKKYSPNVTFAG